MDADLFFGMKTPALRFDTLRTALRAAGEVSSVSRGEVEG